jgi:transcriptional regulator with XRE-family HTH domain
MGGMHRVCGICIRAVRPSDRPLALVGESKMTEAWWESPAVLTAVREGNTGTVIRLARHAKGATQRQTGDACGYSQSEVSRIENGRARVYDIRTLDRLARHLDIPPHLLGLADIDPVDWSVRRRDFFKEAAAGAAAAMLTTNGRGGRGLSDLLALSGPAPEESPTLARLEKRIASAHAVYQRGEYQHVADGLCALIGSTTSGTVLAEDERSRQRVLAAQGWSFVLAAKLATKLDDALTARLAADRALTAATYSGCPVLQGAATYQLACALEAGGERSHAEQVAAIGADHLAAVSDRDPSLVSVRGALLLIAAIAASAQSDAAASGRYLADAQRLAEHLGADCNHAWTGFGPTNVRTHALAAAVRLDQPDRAVEIAGQIDTDRFAPGLVGRRCQVHVEAALAHARQCRDNEAVACLVRVDRIGPQVLRYNQQAQQLIADLLRRGRRTTVPALRGLAHYAAPVGA